MTEEQPPPKDGSVPRDSPHEGAALEPPAGYRRNLERLLESSPAAIMIVNTVSDRVTWANRQARTLFGLDFDGEESIPAPRLWVHNEDRCRFLERYRADGQASGEALLRKAGGEPFSTVLNWQPNPGEPDEYVCWAVDLSGLQEANRRLRFQERMLEAIFDNLPLALFCKDIKNDFRYTHGNAMSVALFGASPKTYIGKTDFDLYPPEIADRYRSTDLRALETGVLEIPEETFIRDNGERLLLRTVKVAIKDGNGEPELLLGISEDITLRQEAERALRNSERRFRDLAASAPVGIFVTDPQGMCLYVNEQWQEMTGLSSQQADGFGWQSAVHEDDRREVTGRWQSFVAGREPFSMEFRFWNPEGQVTWVAGRAVPFRNEAGQAVGYLGTVTNITERKEFERQLQESRDDADHANRAKSEFLSRMSHELRTPLNAILGFGQLLDLERDSLTASQREGVSHILSSGEHLLELIEDVLDLSRIESGNFSLTFQRLSLAPVIADSLSMVSIMAARTGIRIDVPGDSLPDVIGDPHRLQQVLVNLLSNAVKYNRPGGTVTIAVERGDAGTVRIAVADTGIGIQSADHDRVFEPFERAGDRSQNVGGTGIGLSICKLLMDLMGGRIDFDSEHGAGSTFWVELPFGGAGPADVAAVETDEENQDLARLAGMRLLYIEDHMASLTFMQETIRRLPACELRTALNANDGIALARSFRPDVILMDLSLPGMDGWSALEVLQGDARTRKIPVFALSASTSLETLERGYAAGFAQFLPKPVKISHLVAALLNLRTATTKSQKSG